MLGGKMIGGAVRRMRSGQPRGIRAKAPPTAGLSSQTKRRAVAQAAAPASRQVLASGNSMSKIYGKGLTSMREHKVKTAMIAAAGMGIAASVRNSGSGTANGSSGMYR